MPAKANNLMYNVITISNCLRSVLSGNGFSRLRANPLFKFLLLSLIQWINSVFSDLSAFKLGQLFLWEESVPKTIWRWTLRSKHFLFTATPHETLSRTFLFLSLLRKLSPTKVCLMLIEMMIKIKYPTHGQSSHSVSNHFQSVSISRFTTAWTLLHYH